MAQRSLPPGAWLSGYSLPDVWPPGVAAGPLRPFGGAGASPPVTPHAATSPPVTPHAATSPPVTPHAGASPPVTHAVVAAGMSGGQAVFLPGMTAGEWVLTRSGPVPAEPAMPWSGADPDWVWSGGLETLRAQAVRKVRDRLSPPIDPRLPKTKDTRFVDTRAGGPHDPLWRWAEPYRIAAVVAELMGQLSVAGTSLWWRPAPDAGSHAGRRLFALTPPPPGFNYSEQIDKVLRASAEREDRMTEILTQADDIGVFFDAMTGLDRNVLPRLRELIQVAWEVATQLVMLMKNNVAQWRPNQRSARILPVIATPGHGSMPSGHATLSALTAALLSRLLRHDASPQGAERALGLERLARRIAFNRVVAGVHFPMDSEVGHCLARALAGALIAHAEGRAPPAGITLEVTEPDQGLDEAWPPAPPPRFSEKTASAKATTKGEARRLAMKREPQDSSAGNAQDSLWRRLWDAAQREVDANRI